VKPLVLALVAAALALVVAVPAVASEQHPTEGELEAMLVCPSCHVPLDESNSPVAQQMKAFIRERIAQGATRSEIVDELVGPPNNLGDAILGVPQTHGFDLIAWVLPLGGIAAGAVALGGGAWTWSRRREARLLAADEPPLDADLERRVDEELARFDG
jgi:cytochrome c-type biogenesis protein CcmH/NrfF